MTVRWLCAAVLLAIAAPSHAETALSPRVQAFREIYKELVEINTTDGAGDTTRAAEAMAVRLRAAGVPAHDIQVIGSAPRKGNLVARLRGTGAMRPILLVAHLDVVEAKREDWAFDPFTLQEIDGVFRGRGTVDNKAMAASFVANLAEYAREGLRPARDIILVLTADEELSNSPHNGVRWLLQNHRALIDAELAINEGGSGTLRNGKPVRNSVQLAEKLYQSYRLEVTDRGGHSAAPRRDNPIYRLSRGLARLADYEFPIVLNAVTRAYFERIRATEEGEVAEAIGALLAGTTNGKEMAPLAERPQLNAQLRSTCVATLVEAGHAENALPQTARATVNCRVLPDQSVSDVEKTLARVIDDPQIKVTPLGQTVLSPPSPPNVAVLEVVTALTEEMWPGVPVILTMSGGYTDNRWLRGAGIPAYGVSGLFTDPGKSGVHGLNEQVGVKELYDSKEFLYRLVKRLAVAP